MESYSSVDADCLLQMNSVNSRKTTQNQFEYHANHFNCHCDPSKRGEDPRMTTKVDLMVNVDFVILQEQFNPCFYRRTVYHANHFNC